MSKRRFGTVIVCATLAAAGLGARPRGEPIGSAASAQREVPQYLALRTPPELLATGTGDHEAETRAYYAAWGAPPTLDAFRQIYGFDAPRADVAGAVYYNAGDLGLGRELRCVARGDGVRACYVRNYGGFTVPAAAALEDAARRRNPIATVAMAFEPSRGPENAVNYVAYDGAGRQLLSLALDTVGLNTAIPFNCLNCHGGIYDLQSHRVTQASFLPADLPTFEYASFRGYSRREQENELRRINAHVYEIALASPETPRPIVDLIDGWYGGPGWVRVPSARFHDDFVPEGWRGHEEVYTKAIRPFCRSCHVAAGPPLDSYDSTFQPNVPLMHYTRSATYGTVCSLHTMPSAEIPMKGFWASNAPALLLQELTRAYGTTITRPLTCPKPGYLTP